MREELHDAVDVLKAERWDFPSAKSIAQKSNLQTHCNGRRQGTRMNDAILSLLFVASTYSINAS